jgi:Reverse transcriptase (RNA-dependent DNA polymerase)
MKANTEDNPTWEQAMNGPDQAGYWKAMEKELTTLEDDKNSWEVVEREGWMNVLPSTWAFKGKRFPDASVRKLKARFCVRGDKQKEGIDYFDTFAPVVSWQTVRLMLVLSIILNLATKQVDYTAAFVHAPIDKPPNYDSLSEEEKKKPGVFVSMPRGFVQPNKVLILQKSLYGLKQAPRNFFLHLKGKLESTGFTSQQDLDPCLFISDKVICLVYVDDTLFYSTKEEYIDEVISRLKNSEMDLEVKGEVAGFLGAHIQRNDQDGSITLTQTGLIKRIIDAVGVAHLPTKSVPAHFVPLVKDEEGDMVNGTFNYSSVIGMLQYLQNHTRPDIT